MLEAATGGVENSEVAVPQMILNLVSRNAAQEMEENAAALHKSELFQSWPISSEQSLVVTASNLDDWNAIAGVSKIEVLPLRRRFPFIFPSANPDTSQPPSQPLREARNGRTMARTLTFAAVLAAGVLIGAASVVWLIGRGVVGASGRGINSAGPNSGGAFMRQIFRGRFQLGFPSILKGLEQMCGEFYVHWGAIDGPYAYNYIRMN